MALSGKLTKKLVENLSAGRHGDGNGLYLVVDPSGARRWIVRVVVKGQKNKKGAPLRTDFGLGGADIVTLNQARERALEYRRMAKQGLNPRFNTQREIPAFEEIAQQVHIDRMPTWKNQKHGQQWINTLRDYAFPKIGRMPIDSIDQPEVMMCLAPIWTEKHETAKRLAQRIKIVLDVAKSKGFRSGENPVTSIKDAQALPKVKRKPKHHKAMGWQDVPAFYADLRIRKAMAAKALMFTCLAGSRTGEVLGARWGEIDFETRIWTCPEGRMKTGEEHRVPLTDEMLDIIRPLKAMKSEYVFEGQKRHNPLSNMSMLMLLRRMEIEGVTVHGFRATFRDWASEVANGPREVAEMSLSHKVGSDVERAYARSDLLAKRRTLMERWSSYVASGQDELTELSRLWRDATPDLRGRLSEIVGTVHKNWRDSLHYSSVSELERLPRADVHWSSDVNLGDVDFGWQGDGAEVVIVVTLHMSDTVFPLLGNEPRIHMLQGWLRIGGPDGIPEDITDDEIDRSDFRKHLGFLEDKPSQLMWSTVKLYELGACRNRGFGRFGYDCWGFWRIDGEKGFLFFTEDVPIPKAFVDASAVLDRQDFASPFKSMCDGGNIATIWKGL